MGSDLSRVVPSFIKTSYLPTTSTQKYGHESFSTFKDKIPKLADDLDSCSIDDVRHLDGGTYNRVAMARVRWRHEESSHLGMRYVIFRFPRFPQKIQPDSDIQNQVAAFTFVKSQGIHVPPVLAFDATSANACGSPYVVYDLVDAHQMDSFLGRFSTEDRLDLANQVVDLQAKLEVVECEYPGRIVRGPSMSTASRWSMFSAETNPHPWDMEVREIHGDGPPAFSESDTHISVLSLIRNGLNRRAASLDGCGNADWELRIQRTYYIRLHHLCDELEKDDCFHGVNEMNFRNILYHWDLEPRNILVRRIEDRWRIVSIIDWDDARFLPSILCRRPPTWLWDPSYQRRSWNKGHGFREHGNIDSFDPKFESELTYTKDAKRVREHFETLYVEKVMSIAGRGTLEAYNAEAYGVGKWVRRLWWFAEHGIHGRQELLKLEALESDWQNYKSQS